MYDLAVRKNGVLIGLCYDALELDRVILKLHVLERSPMKNNPMTNQFVDIALFAANLYARLNDSKELRLCNPVSPVHVRLYQGKGYDPQTDRFDTVSHLTKRLK